MPALPVPVITIGLLVASNIFMTFAWYGHLKFKGAPLVTVIFISWGIALFEYMLMVPANRIGHTHFSAAELKTIQEVITLLVFGVFSVFFLKEPLTWNHILGFSFIALGAFFIFHKW
ncbi:DMT family protein [Gemmobacter serpentinus]|uniref:DMT family protein n=1 Tax=Gemmobacter serpentinus TaxID=2652247 RepID=UPI00124CB1D9|nr:DMT family protein [Gemmobacter serpentinus]